MMITALPARRLPTVVFAAAGLAEARPCGRGGAGDPARSASISSERTVARASAAAVLPVHGQVLAPAELLQASGEQILDPPQALLVGCFGADR
jgi:hypothetical protein